MNKEVPMFYIVVISVIFYLFGMMTARYNVFPYPQIVSLKNSLTTKKNPKNPKESFSNDNAIKLYKMYVTKEANIVMFGDSLIDNVDWSELVGVDIINRGVGYDTTEGYLKRMDSVYNLKPKKVFLNGGTNDFLAGYSVDEVFANYKKIISILQEHNIKPYMLSVVFTRMEKINEKIIKVNKLLEQYCKDNNIVYIDLNKKLSSNNMLMKEHTTDGAHLTAKGYGIWRDIIKEYIK